VSGEPKRVPAVFFRSTNGVEPVRRWLRSQSKEDRFRIGSYIKTVEYGWPVGMPTCRSLGQGLYEVRTNLKNRTARVIFCIKDGHVVLLHGFIKKSQKTPRADLDLARNRMRLLEAASD
jgi:phage-related protein